MRYLSSEVYAGGTNDGCPMLSAILSMQQVSNLESLVVFGVAPCAWRLTLIYVWTAFDKEKELNDRVLKWPRWENLNQLPKTSVSF